jgi:Zn finger protein HypA/HybF involved in hydrogenase expression
MALFNPMFYQGKVVELEITQQQFEALIKEHKRVQCPHCFKETFNIVLSAEVLVAEAKIGDKLGVISGYSNAPEIIIKRIQCTYCGEYLKIEELLPAIYCYHCGKPVFQVYREYEGIAYHPECLYTRYGREAFEAAKKITR